uniref:Ig-like domain-containing protein n=1 Tax=Salvator merianae TaxID=96440 RepID=A0A8D0BK32_SALMN
RIDISGMMQRSLWQNADLILSSSQLGPADKHASAPTCLTNTRFVAAKWGAKVSLICHSHSPAFWHKEIGKEVQKVVNSSRVLVTGNDSMTIMKIHKLQDTDNGIYFCLCNSTTQKMSCGTELKVLGISTFDQVQSRNNVKDAVIFIQTFLLVLFTSIPLYITLGKVSFTDLFEEMPMELADTYEDIGHFQDKAEKWDLKEHPNKE